LFVFNLNNIVIVGYGKYFKNVINFKRRAYIVVGVGAIELQVRGLPLSMRLRGAGLIAILQKCNNNFVKFPLM
jgi:hypothetical protein